MNVRRASIFAAPAIALGLLSAHAHASDVPNAQRSESKERAQKPEPKQERIYGSQLMTREERLEHREKLRNAKTREERQQIRKEHRDKMKERAKERGVKLPDDPPAPGSGAGPGPAMGGSGGYRP